MSHLISRWRTVLMTLPQAASIALVTLMMAAFLWGRIRFDVVALLSLLAGLALGLIPAKEAFKGFSDDIVIIVASALVVSAAVARARIIETFIARVAPFLRTPQAQVPFLVAVVALLSAVIKNIGALAMMLPVAYRFARASKVSASLFLMPMAFASLLGGTITLVGTSPNVIVARMRAELTGQPFSMFDFAPVGIGIAVVGCLFLSFGYRLLPRDRRAAVTLDQAIDIKDYVTEARVEAGSPLIGQPLSTLAGKGEEVRVVALLRGERRIVAPLPDALLRERDILLIQGDADTLERVVEEGELALEGRDRRTEEPGSADPALITEAIVGPGSVLVGQSPADIALHARYGVNLVAISRAGIRLKERLRDIRMQPGDVLVVQGDQALLPEKLFELNLLPLADREIRLGGPRRALLTGAIVLGIIVTLVFELAPVAVVFFAAAVLLIALRALPARDAMRAIDAPILLMLAALIPVSDTLRTTGATDVMAGWLAMAGERMPGWASVTLMMAAAMAVTPFLNNAATVLVMAPIGAGFAQRLGYNADPFLMAVAIGAASDFLTPIGHQCNTLVMGPGGYKFSDYPRLGAPLSLIVLAVGVPLILIFWPLA